MQVATRIVRQCPFLLESDRLQLAPAVVFDPRRHMLLDEIGIEHRVRPPGGCIAYALASGLSVNEMRRLASGHGIEDLQLSEILGFLNAIGGLVRRRRPVVVPVAWLTQLSHLFLTVGYGRLSWRRKATAGNLLLGVVRAGLPVVTAAAIVAIIAAAGGIVPAKDSLVMVCFGTILFMASLFGHELLHTAIAGRNGSPAAVIQIGMRLGIIHRPLTPRAELCSALAGPAAGLAVGVLGGMAAVWYAAPLGWLGLAIGLFHLGGFLPWYGDGLSLRRAFRRRHESLA